MASTPSASTYKRCSVPGCGKPLRVRGFCVACYYRFLRRGAIKLGSQSKRWKHRLSKIDSANKTAFCQACGPTCIYPRGKNQWRCGTEAAERSRVYKRAYRKSKRIMLKPACEICGSSKKLCWDHCHDENIFRGTLCNTCNLAIGYMKNNPQYLRSAADYLEKFVTRVAVVRCTKT